MALPTSFVICPSHQASLLTFQYSSLQHSCQEHTPTLAHGQRAGLKLPFDQRAKDMGWTSQPCILPVGSNKQVRCQWPPGTWTAWESYLWYHLWAPKHFKTNPNSWSSKRRFWKPTSSTRRCSSFTPPPPSVGSARQHPTNLLGHFCSTLFHMQIAQQRWHQQRNGSIQKWYKQFHFLLCFCPVVFLPWDIWMIKFVVYRLHDDSSIHTCFCHALSTAISTFIF
jgi:hypothetical protein